MPVSKKRKRKKSKPSTSRAGQAAEQRVYSVDEALNIAIQLHQTGRLREAEGFYKKLLAQLPDHPARCIFLASCATSRAPATRPSS